MDNAMVVITDPTIKRLILEHLVERMDQGADALDELLCAGVDPQLLDFLRERPGRDFVNAAKVEQFRITAAFDSRAVIASFGRLDALRRDAQLREYYVVHGAPPELLADFFKLSMDEIRRLRSLLLPGGTPPGRPKMPPTDVRDRVHVDWARLTQEIPSTAMRERLYQLHRLHDKWSIHALWSTVHEFEEAPPLRRSVT